MEQFDNAMKMLVRYSENRENSIEAAYLLSFVQEYAITKGKFLILSQT